MGKSGEGQNCEYLTVVMVPDNFIVRCQADSSSHKLDSFSVIWIICLACHIFGRFLQATSIQILPLPKQYFCHFQEKLKKS